MKKDQEEQSFQKLMALPSEKVDEMLHQSMLWEIEAHAQPIYQQCQEFILQHRSGETINQNLDTYFNEEFLPHSLTTMTLAIRNVTELEIPLYADDFKKILLSLKGINHLTEKNKLWIQELSKISQEKFIKKINFSW